MGTWAMPLQNVHQNFGMALQPPPSFIFICVLYMCMMYIFIYTYSLMCFGIICMKYYTYTCIHMYIISQIQSFFPLFEPPSFFRVIYMYSYLHHITDPIFFPPISAPSVFLSWEQMKELNLFFDLKKHLNLVTFRINVNDMIELKTTCLFLGERGRTSEGSPQKSEQSQGYRHPSRWGQV